MSYEIYYDRAFIRVWRALCPLVNQGSNNAGKRIGMAGISRRKKAGIKCSVVLNYFYEDEVRQIAKDYEQVSRGSGTCFKTRHRPFGEGEFERWILCGLKSAYTIEEYVRFGNGFSIHDYSANNMDDWKLYPFSTTAEFLNLLEELKNSRLLNIHIHDNRHVCRPHRDKKWLKDYRKQKEYFVLSRCMACMITGSFFLQVTKHSYLSTVQSCHESVRTFPTVAWPKSISRSIKTAFRLYR
jgi:hypothetical protein